MNFSTIFLLLLTIVLGKAFKLDKKKLAGSASKKALKTVIENSLPELNAPEKPHLFSCDPLENYDKSVWHCGNGFFSHHSSRIVAMLTFDKKSINYCCAEFSYYIDCGAEKKEIHWTFQQCLQKRGNFITRNLIGPLISNLAMVFG
ncbi:unnamed protein product, partial [Mesorhabditis belari]|uniref:Uncharacterized protein n=1 Tax=Mesorhabditis belari TaxID=2138241 RepID=A0AAF3F684_9BILA